MTFRYKISLITPDFVAGGGMISCCEPKLDFPFALAMTSTLGAISMEVDVVSIGEHCFNQGKRIGFYQAVSISFLTILQLCRNLIPIDFTKVFMRVAIMHRWIVIGLLIVLSMAISLSSIWGGTIIAEATLHITLYVPSAPVTYDLTPGEYQEYDVERTDSVIYIAAK